MRFAIPCHLASRTCAVLALTALAMAAPRQLDVGAEAASAAPLRSLRAEPAFVANLGQWQTDAAFVARGSDSVLRADANGIWLDLASGSGRPRAPVRTLVRLEFSGGASIDPVGEGTTEALSNYFLGDDPEQWRTAVPGYTRLAWRGRWPGVDVYLHAGSADALAEYELRLAPNADLNSVALVLRGAESIGTDDAGRLVANLPTGMLTQSAPKAWEVLPDGARRDLAVSFRLLGSSEFGFHVEQRDSSRPLVIDPGLVWSSYLGGGFDEVPAGGCVLDAANQPVICGWTYSVDFPTTPGVYQPSKDEYGDIFVTQLRANGSALLFSTYIGGSLDEWGWSVDLDATGSILVAGHTNSANFPTTAQAVATSLWGTRDAIVLKLSPAGSQLQFSSYLGGEKQEEAHAIKALPDGSIVAGGWTSSLGFPTTPGAFDTTHGGLADAFLTRIDPQAGMVAAGTYLGGVYDDDLRAIELGALGSVIVGGTTKSPNFPTTPGAYDEVYDHPFPGFAFVTHVVRLGKDLDSLEFSTMLESSGDTAVLDIAVASDGRVAVVGYTDSPDFPATSNTFDPNLGPSVDAFIGVLSPDGSSLEYGTYLGGSGPGNDYGVAIHLADSGVVTVVGFGHSHFFPATPGCYDTVASVDSPDLYVTRFHPSGGSLFYSSYVGNPIGSESAWGGAVDSRGQVYLIGTSNWIDFPTTPGAYDPTFGGSGPSLGYGDAVIAKMDLQPTGVSTLGLSTPACKGPLWLSALGPPQAGSNFSVGCSGAPPSAFGVWVASGAPLPLGIPFAGVQIYLDPAQPYVLFPRTADAIGYSQLDTLLPAGAAGLAFLLQSIWLNTPTCAGAGEFSASHAVTIAVP
jgi:hypothetical protein